MKGLLGGMGCLSLPAECYHVILFGMFCFSHWQQDVEEADTSAICNRTSLSPRSTRPAAPRECCVGGDCSLVIVLL